MAFEKDSMLSSGRAANPLPTQTSNRRGCGTRDTHKLWFNWEPCGMVCAFVVYAVDIGSLYGMHVSRQKGARQPHVLMRPAFGPACTFFRVQFVSSATEMF